MKSKSTKKSRKSHKNEDLRVPATPIQLAAALVGVKPTKRRKKNGTNYKLEFLQAMPS